MDELQFLMTAKLIGKYEERISDFITVIKEYVEQKHEATFGGIISIDENGVLYSYNRMLGYKNQYQIECAEEYASYITILQSNKGETK